MEKVSKNNVLTIGNATIKPGQRQLVDLILPQLYTHTPITMPVHVIRGKKPGPCMFVSAAIHGDELNGIEIIRRLLGRTELRRIRGSLIAVPIVNVYGVVHNSRYLPDRRDLNRSFPGSERGSLAARVANTFMTEIVNHCQYGIDLHTGAIHRDNLPQIRGNLQDRETETLARAFKVPVLINATLRDGSLREAATEQGVKMLLYEAGEALRFDEVSIRAGVRGILRVMRLLGMLPVGPRHKIKREPEQPYIASSSSWIRAPGSGFLQLKKRLGQHIYKKDVIGLITDPYGNVDLPVVTPFDGLVIGHSQIPLVHEGDAVCHLARFDEVEEVADGVESFRDNMANDFDDLSPLVDLV